MRLPGVAAGAEKQNCDQDKKKHRDAERDVAASRGCGLGGGSHYLGG